VTKFEMQGLGRNENKMKPYSHTITTSFWFFFFLILYSYKYLYYYIYSWLSVITTLLKPLKPLTATDLVGYRFLITDYEIGFSVIGYCRLSVAGQL
jgi:hypothetical protein